MKNIFPQLLVLILILSGINIYCVPGTVLKGTIVVLSILVFYLLHRMNVLLKKEKSESRTDFLTGIRNRKGFCEIVELEMKRFHRFKRPFALVYIDIDNFKSINDNYGHKEGDKVLRDFAELLRKNIREIDYCGRLGGDEFAIIFLEVDDQLETILYKIRETFFKIFDKYNISLSAGVVVYKKLLNTVTVENIIDFADKEMYHIKGDHKNDLKIRVIE